MGQQIGDRGEFKNFSQASASTNFYPKILRLFWYEARIFVKILFWIFLTGLVICISGFFLGGVSKLLEVAGYVVGGLVLLLGFVGLGFCGYLAKHMRENFKNGLLTAAIIDDRTDNSVIHIAVLSNGGSAAKDYVYGIKRINYSNFPYKCVGDNQRIACVSVFDDRVRHRGSWHSFNPTPIAFGTANKARIQQCLDFVSDSEDGSYFDILDKFMAKQQIPKDFKDLYVCDGEGNLIELRVLDDANENQTRSGATPPPLPTQK